MSFHLHTEDFTFLQIYHSATNYAMFFKRHAPPERPAICKSLYLVTDLLGLRNSLTKQVGEHKNFRALLFHLRSFSFYQKLAANLHSFMIISQSFAGANNNEKQDLNRSIGIQFSVHMPLPPPHPAKLQKLPAAVCSVNLLLQGKSLRCAALASQFSLCGQELICKRRRVKGK